MPIALEPACSSSSIGRNSDGEEKGSDGGDESEVQSSYRGPLDTMDALEDSLPFSRRGISQFYCGKSKTFTNLSDALSKSASAKDLAKPENACTRKRKNLFSFNFIRGKSRNKDLPKSEESATSKKRSNTKSSRRCKMTTMDDNSSSTGSNSSTSGEEEQGQNHLLLPPYPNKPPTAITKTNLCSKFSCSKHQVRTVPVRSFSMADLQAISGSKTLVAHGDRQRRNY